METKFVEKNVGSKPAFILITAEASIDGKSIEVKNQTSESESQVIMPAQHIKYRGLVIEGKTFKTILNGELRPTIVQNIKIEYGDTEKDVGHYFTFQSARLDAAKLARCRNQPNTRDGLWLLDKSNSR